jgi:hypothetical protein
VDDVYRRFVNPYKSEEYYVAVGRASTVGLIVLASAISLWLENALQAFQILLQIGAGTGLIFLLRWFWWRINAWSEISAMVISFVVALYFQFGHVALGFSPVHPSLMLVLGVLITTVVWLTVTLLTPPTETATLQSFYDKIHPSGRGWTRIVDTTAGQSEDSITAAFLCWFLGCVLVYGALLGTGFFIYGNFGWGVACGATAVLAGAALFRTLPKVGFH